MTVLTLYSLIVEEIKCRRAFFLPRQKGHDKWRRQINRVDREYISEAWHYKIVTKFMTKNRSSLLGQQCDKIIHEAVFYYIPELSRQKK